MSRANRSAMGSRDKEMRRVLKAITDAGGRYERTSKYHFKVYGPAGIAVIPNRMDASPRSRGNIITSLRRNAGLDLS